MITYRKILDVLSNLTDSDLDCPAVCIDHNTKQYSPIEFCGFLTSGKHIIDKNYPVIMINGSPEDEDDSVSSEELPEDDGTNWDIED